MQHKLSGSLACGLGTKLSSKQRLCTQLKLCTALRSRSSHQNCIQAHAVAPMEIAEPVSHKQAKVDGKEYSDAGIGALPSDAKSKPALCLTVGGQRQWWTQVLLLKVGNDMQSHCTSCGMRG